MFVFKVILSKEIILNFEDRPTREEILTEADASEGMITEFRVEELFEDQKGS
jgi:hypothetical protein